MSNNRVISTAQLKANATKKSKYLRYSTAKLQEKLSIKTQRLESILVKVYDLHASIKFLRERLSQTCETASGGDHEV